MTKTYAVPPHPPHNEGKTAAAWTLTMGVVFGSAIVAAGMILAMMLLVWIGIGVMALAIIAGIVMSLAGLGQPKPELVQNDSR
ncbi:HGxxPAAW family protein [Brachybacterium sp. GCM10030267]|uniref:HGxxPAAW family protein n=1 Tax=unclassified Brachybacterium TaxID=2623841 RepID=UPI0036077543